MSKLPKTKKQFGLVKLQGFKPGVGTGKARKATGAKPLRAPAAGFGAADDPAEDVGAGRVRKGIDVGGVNASLVQLQKQTDGKVEQLAQAAQADDPNIFQYDELYDKLHADREEATAARAQAFDPSAGRARKESRYISHLKKAAEIRAVDDERVFQMKLKKEADAEAHIYGDKEKFITSHYKEKLKEMQRWREEDARLQEQEQATTMDGGAGLTGFYSNLLTKNLAMGSGDVAKHGTSGYTVGTKHNEHIRAREAAQREDFSRKRDSAESARAEDAPTDEESLLRLTEGSEAKRRKLEAGPGDAAPAPAEAGAGAAAAASAVEAAPTTATAAPPVDPAEAERRAAEQKEKRAVAIKAAKERYLARRKGP